ncbi:MAG TPA: CpsD/CapB family tyrosine-protein kinase [Candidatus Methanoperedens sp.]|nr:CpsD/CapB family tyrosine-protein kinase [Candidatus Methanoperedens sp.]
MATASSPAVPGPPTGAGVPSGPKSRRGRLPADLWAHFGEEFRSLRTRVATRLDARHKIVLVTSALPQEGKTTVSSALARSFAQMEWRTVLVDCDLRKPGVHSLFGVDRSPGITDVLQGQAREEQCLAATDSSFLDLIPAGSPADGPSELLHADVTPRYLRDLASRYDYVVVDSPPLTSITDTHLLAQYADGILLVVRGRVSPRDLVQSAREQLLERPVLGIVLNGISTPRKYSYYY